MLRGGQKYTLDPRHQSLTARALIPLTSQISQCGFQQFAWEPPAVWFFGYSDYIFLKWIPFHSICFSFKTAPFCIVIFLPSLSLTKSNAVENSFHCFPHILSWDSFLSHCFSSLIKKILQKLDDLSIVSMKWWQGGLPHHYLLILSVYWVLEKCRYIWRDSASGLKRPALDCSHLLQRLPPGQSDTAALMSSLFQCPGRGCNCHKGSRQFDCW